MAERRKGQDGWKCERMKGWNILCGECNYYAMMICDRCVVSLARLLIGLYRVENLNSYQRWENEDLFMLFEKNLF